MVGQQATTQGADSARFPPIHPAQYSLDGRRLDLYQSWFAVPKKTSCDAKERQPSASDVQRHPGSNAEIPGAPLPDNPYQHQIDQMRRELNEPCEVCLYTGVSVCMGLSVYFANLAIDEGTLAKNRRFLWICSAGSVAAGVYRWYLG